MLVYHVETAVVLIDRGIVVFLTAAYHDIRTCSQFYGPARGSALPALVIDIIIHKYVLVIRTWRQSNLKLYSHTA